MSTNNMIDYWIYSIHQSLYCINETSSLYSFLNPKFLKLKPIISGSILATDSKNFACVPFTITPYIT